jgi:Ni/Fe-hydrogenase subunit HybB-like protein
MLASLARPITITVALYLALRLGDLAWRGQLGRAASLDRGSFFFLLETALFVAALVFLRMGAARRDLAALFRAALLLMVGGALYRFDTYLVGFNPGAGWSYFPAVPEMLVTLGVVALEVLGYVAIVKAFPVLSGATEAPVSRAA